MRFSAHTIFSRIKDSKNSFIVNLLTGSADILSPVEALRIEALKSGEPADAEFIKELEGKGYILDEVQESALFRKKYLDFLDSREEDEIQLFLILNYSCNFACTYCYQDEYTAPDAPAGKEMADAFFQYIQHEFSGRKKYITIFGGEPLLNSPKQKELIGYVLEKAKTAGLEICIVTNGYTLESYVPMLRGYAIREIQVTLDGTASYHDARRFLKGGQGTFNTIIGGIDACLQHGITVNLRMVIDRENIENLPEFAQFVIDKGWTTHPEFKTQIGRNYELHHCQSAPDKLFTRISLYEKLYEMTKQHPHILDFYKPAYSISKFLAENGNLPDPLFDSCPACKLEWAFDYTGHIYPCTATVGKKDESLGTFYPEISLDKTRVREWGRRDIVSIHGCSECSLQLACGGGCGSVAKNKNGSIQSPDCRPIKELLELGMAQYFE